MAQAPRFQLDESFTSRIAVGLQRRGWDCSTTKSAGLRGDDDDAQFAFTVTEQRILITADDDFLAIARRRPDHFGIVYWRGERHFGQLVKWLDELFLALSAEDFRGTVHYF